MPALFETLGYSGYTKLCRADDFKGQLLGGIKFLASYRGNNQNNEQDEEETGKEKKSDLFGAFAFFPHYGL